MGRPTPIAIAHRTSQAQAAGTSELTSASPYRPAARTPTLRTMDFSTSKIEGRISCCIPTLLSDSRNATTGDSKHGCRYLSSPHHHIMRNVTKSMVMRPGPHGIHAIAARDINAGDPIVETTRPMKLCVCSISVSQWSLTQNGRLSDCAMSTYISFHLSASRIAYRGRRSRGLRQTKKVRSMFLSGGRRRSKWHEEEGLREMFKVSLCLLLLTFLPGILKNR